MYGIIIQQFFSDFLLFGSGVAWKAWGSRSGVSDSVIAEQILNFSSQLSELV